MTDAEIVARAIGRASAKWNDTQDSYNNWVAAAVVAALTEAGRLVPPGCVAIQQDLWEKMRAELECGCCGEHLWFMRASDLDAELTP